MDTKGFVRNRLLARRFDRPIVVNRAIQIFMGTQNPPVKMSSTMDSVLCVKLLFSGTELYRDETSIIRRVSRVSNV